MSNPPEGKPLSFWLRLLGVILLVCVVALVALHLHRQTGAAVQVLQDGDLIATLPLDRDTTVTYDSPNGGRNTVTIQDGRVSVTEATCPDQVCVRHGPTDQTADPIVCLPNKLVVQVVSPNQEIALDGVAS